jgi:hypothetical protein
MRALVGVAVVPIALVLLVVIVVQAYNEITRPQTITVRIKDGPTILSTQVVRLDGR